MDASTSIEPGTVLADKYEVRGELGRGGMATIYEAVHVEIGKRVAIKLLAGHLTKSAAVVERFLREARAVAAIRSPYICDVYDSGKTDEGVPFLVLELLEGESLYERMVEDRQMSVEFTVAVVLQACRGLAKAHEANIVHRDLKPENIHVTFDDEGHMAVKILDFGLAKFYEEPVEEYAAPVAPARAEPGTGKRKGGRRKRRLTRDGAVFGTPTYMSPEQVRGQGSADPRSDLWALACIAYECLTGTTVWSTDEGVAMTFVRIASAPLPDPTDLRPDLPEAFNDWFAKALNREMDNRYQDVRELADGLIAAFSYSAPDGGFDSGLQRRLQEAAPELKGDWVARWVDRAARPPSLAALEERRPAAAPKASRAEVASSKPSRRHSGWPLVVGAALAAALLTYFLWQRQAPSEMPTAVPWLARAVSSASAGQQATPPSGQHLLKQHPWLKQVRQAQGLVAQGDHDGALGLLRGAFETSQHGMVRNLLEQLQVAMLARSVSAPCQVTGYARPRRYDLHDPSRKPVRSSPPHIAWGPKGALVTWADRRERKARAHVVLLDNSLRNRSLPVEVTPEGHSVYTPLLLPSGDRVLAIYWDAAGDGAGVYLRWLTSTGVIATAPVRVTEPKAGRYMATGARAGGDGWLVAWTARTDPDSTDLFFRTYDDELKPRGRAIRATDYTTRGGARGQVREAALHQAGDSIHTVYAFWRDPLAQVRYQVIPTSAEPPGIVTLDAGLSSKDRTLDDEQVLSPTRQRASEPALGCVTAGCYVAWHGGAKDGASVAFIETASGKTRWEKQFTLRGGHPSIGVTPSGEALLAWSEGGRLAVAALGPDGVGSASKVARIVGEQPPPSVTAGGKRGEWYLAWADFEAGHLEPYVVRVLCQ